jgi:hypothetical protein
MEPQKSDITLVAAQHPNLETVPTRPVEHFDPPNIWRDYRMTRREELCSKNLSKPSR